MKAGFSLLAFAALLLGATCDLVDDVRKTIQDFKALMPIGDSDLCIPQLEPLSIRELPISIKVTPFNAKLVAKNIVATGASGFEVTKISRRDDGKLAVALNIPNIEVTADYNIDGKVKVGFRSFKLSGNGPLTLSAAGINGEGVADVVEDANGDLHANDLQISSWSYERIRVQLDNLFGGGVMSKTVNTLINRIVPVFIKSNKDKINKLVQSKARSFINKYLDGNSGNKPSLEIESGQIESVDWNISSETQEILEQLAKIVVGAQVTEDSTPTPLEDQAMKILESFKLMMKDGRMDFNIPILDPAVVDKLVIDVQHTLLRAKIIASDANVLGVSDFTVKKLSQVGNANKLTVEVAVLDIKIASQFVTKGKVWIPLPVSLNDKGALQLNVTDLTMTATVEITNNGDGSYNINSVAMNSWTFKSIKIQLENLLGGGVIGKAANDLFNRIFPTLVENDRAKINKRLENVVKNLFNAYLDGMAGKTSADVTTKLQEISSLFRSAMRSGRADINIPVMDPAVVEELSVKVEKWPVRADVNLDTVTVSGASDFKLTRVSQIVGTNKVAVDFEVPSLVATSNYNFQSTIHAAFIKFNVNRKGPVRLSVLGMSGTAIVELAVEDDNELSLLGLEVETWTFNSIEAQVDNLLNGGFFKRMLNSLLNKLIPGLLVKPHIEDVRKWASAAGKQVIGKFMDAVAGRVVLPNLDTRAMKLLQDLQTILQNGNKKYDMPVYDPAKVDQIAFSIEVLKQEASLVVSDITIAGTSDYKIIKISQTSNTNNLDIEIVAPALSAHCKFDAKTSGIFKLKDAGSASVKIDNLNVSATASLTSNIEGSLVLRDLQISSWSTSGITASFDNLISLGTLGKALQKIINSVLPKIVNTKKAALTEWAQIAAKSVLDKFLAGVAAESKLPHVIRIDAIDTEAHGILMQLATLAVESGIAA